MDNGLWVDFMDRMDGVDTIDGNGEGKMTKKLTEHFTLEEISCVLRLSM